MKHMIGIYFTDAELAIIERESKKENRTRSNWLNCIIKKHLEDMREEITVDTSIRLSTES